jgi:TonB family protein
VAQEEPVTAGSEGVPVPKKTKFVKPIYPPEALAQGIRGIVILDLVLDVQGKVEETNVIRSVPGLDAAAIAAARQWEYEPTKVGGKPVRVRLTVPITFALALPELARQSGVPELRQGASPAWPAGASGGGLVTAEVTLEPDGRVGGARVLEGGAPWAPALLAALRTWRFAPPPEDEVLSFRIEAEFVPAGGSNAPRIDLKASGLQRSGFLPEPAPAATVPAAPEAHEAEVEEPPTVSPTSAPAAAGSISPQDPTLPGSSAPQEPPPPASAESQAPRAPEAGSSREMAPAGTAPAPEGPRTPVPGPPSAATPSPAAPAPDSVPAVPVEEVITAPPPAPPPENGVSAIRDVTLEPGVPDLTRGRRPVTPPLARMTGATGKVEVTFSVGASGATTIQGTSGPELLRPAAEQAVASWVFRRTRADRAYLIAIFDYSGDKGSAVVRPHPSPAPGSATAPAPAPAIDVPPVP